MILSTENEEIPSEHIKSSPKALQEMLISLLIHRGGVGEEKEQGREKQRRSKRGRNEGEVKKE